MNVVLSSEVRVVLSREELETLLANTPPATDQLVLRIHLEDALPLHDRIQGWLVFPNVGQASIDGLLELDPDQEVRHLGKETKDE